MARRVSFLTIRRTDVLLALTWIVAAITLCACSAGGSAPPDAGRDGTAGETRADVSSDAGEDVNAWSPRDEIPLTLGVRVQYLVAC